MVKEHVHWVISEISRLAESISDPSDCPQQMNRERVILVSREKRQTLIRKTEVSKNGVSDWVSEGGKEKPFQYVAYTIQGEISPTNL